MESKSEVELVRSTFEVVGIVDCCIRAAMLVLLCCLKSFIKFLSVTRGCLSLVELRCFVVTMRHVRPPLYCTICKLRGSVQSQPPGSHDENSRSVFRTSQISNVVAAA